MDSQQIYVELMGTYHLIYTVLFDSDGPYVPTLSQERYPFPGISL